MAVQMSEPQQRYMLFLKDCKWLLSWYFKQKSQKLKLTKISYLTVVLFFLIVMHVEVVTKLSCPKTLSVINCAEQVFLVLEYLFLTLR